MDKYFTKEFMKPLFEVLDKCEGVKQVEKYHPEGDVLTHTIQVFNKAFRETRDIDLLLACLLHDVGKQVNRLNHVKESLNLIDDIASCKTKWLVKNHMRIWTYINGEMRKLSRCVELAEHPWLPELLQLARFDKIGRIKNYKPKYDKDVIIDKLNKAYDEHWQGEEPVKRGENDKTRNMQ